MSPVLLKTCTYCLMHLTVAISVAFCLTRSWRAALAIGVLEPLVQTFAFALHERVWAVRASSGVGESTSCAQAALAPRGTVHPRAPSRV